MPRLLAAGLLRQVDDETVILPRVVGQVLRGEEPGPVSLTEPTPATTTTTAADADAAAAGAVIDILREADLVFETLGATPVPELRSGGLGVREVKRLTKVTGIDEHRLGLILEISAAAGLIAVGLPRPEPLDGDGPYWAPTVQADRFTESPIAARWHLLATTWLDLPSRPGLTGRRGADNKPIAALSDALFSTAASLDRRLLLGLLAELPVRAGLLAVEASRMLLWRRPRWSLRLQPGPVGELLDEATALGLVGRGALTSPARALISESCDDPVAAMNRILPAPIDHFLLQADLTVVVPGPLRRELSDQLAELAVVESAGAAMVYRISEASIRRAHDIGHTAGALHAFFQKYSKTPVPQGLTYLIDDVARRHGQLRVGIAASFVRCDDTALLAQVAAAPLADAMQLRLLAPTVAVAQAPIADVLAALRDAGFAPAAEDATGAIVDLRPRGARITDAPHRRSFRGIAPPATQTLEAIVATLRQVAATPPVTRVDAGTAVLLLQQAVRDQASVVMGYVDPAGVATQRVVSPISVRGGQLMAFDPASGRVRDFAVHRVTSVVSIDDEISHPRRDAIQPQSSLPSVRALEYIGHDDRRTPDRAVRQDGAARSRPRPRQRGSCRDRAVRGAGAGAGARAHLPDHAACAVERPAAGHDAEQVVDALVSYSRYAVPQPLLIDVVDTMARYGRLQLAKHPALRSDVAQPGPCGARRSVTPQEDPRRCSVPALTRIQSSFIPASAATSSRCC